MERCEATDPRHAAIFQLDDFTVHGDSRDSCSTKRRRKHSSFFLLLLTPSWGLWFWSDVQFASTLFSCCKTHEQLAILYDSTQMSLLWPTFHSAFFVVAFWAMQFVLQLALTRRRRFWCSFVSHWWSCITSAWGDWETNYCSFVVADLYYHFFSMAIVSYPLPYLVQEENQSIIIATAANNRIKSSKLRIISMNHQCTSIVMSIPSRRPSDSDTHHNSWIQFRSDLFVSFPVDYGHPVTIERCKPRKILLQIVIQLHKKSNIDLLQQALEQFKTILSLCSPKTQNKTIACWSWTLLSFCALWTKTNNSMLCHNCDHIVRQIHTCSLIWKVEDFSPAHANLIGILSVIAFVHYKCTAKKTNHDKIGTSFSLYWTIAMREAANVYCLPFDAEDISSSLLSSYMIFLFARRCNGWQANCYHNAIQPPVDCRRVPFSSCNCTRSFHLLSNTMAVSCRVTISAFSLVEFLTLQAGT